MNNSQASGEQQHPREQRDRTIVKRLLEVRSPSEDLDLVELARLKIRYQGFPGAKKIQQDLDKILQTWNLTPEQLFERTRQIHARGRVYKQVEAQAEDWS